jgi:protein-tyrosine kinase
MNSIAKERKAASPTTHSVKALLGKHLLDAGKLTEPDIARIVEAQRRSNLRFGEVAIALGLLSNNEIQEALSRQFDYPYLGSDAPELNPLLFTANQPFGAHAEALRTLRSRLMLTWFNDRRKTIAVTASRAGEGASILAANLAIVFAQLGERTLLVDANFRRPRQHDLFGLNSGAGLSKLLTWRCDAKDVLVPVLPFQNLSILSTGALPPNPQELLSGVGFSYLMETAPASFDIVIFDTPPILEFSDAQIVAARSGGCLLATRRHQTRLSDLERVKELLELSTTALVGAVFSR